MRAPWAIRCEIAALPLELAASGQVIEFSEKISDFERLAAIVEADLEALDPDKLPSGWRDSLVSGRLSFGFADAQNNCRCSRAGSRRRLMRFVSVAWSRFEMPLAADLRLLLGDAESAGMSDDDLEIWELDEEHFGRWISLKKR